jgi:hypothetical protein
MPFGDHILHLDSESGGRTSLPFNASLRRPNRVRLFLFDRTTLLVIFSYASDKEKLNSSKHRFEKMTSIIRSFNYSLVSVYPRWMCSLTTKNVIRKGLDFLVPSPTIFSHLPSIDGVLK